MTFQHNPQISIKFKLEQGWQVSRQNALIKPTTEQKAHQKESLKIQTKTQSKTQETAGQENLQEKQVD